MKVNDKQKEEYLNIAFLKEIFELKEDGFSLGSDTDYQRQVVRAAVSKIVYGQPKGGVNENNIIQ